MFHKIIKHIFIGAVIAGGVVYAQGEVEGKGHSLGMESSIDKFTIQEHNNTRFKFKTTTIESSPAQWKPKEKVLYTEKIVVERKSGCETSENYVIFSNKDLFRIPKQVKRALVDNKIKINEDTICIDKNTMYYSLKEIMSQNEERIIIYQSKGDWTIEMSKVFPGIAISKEDMFAQCSVIEVNRGEVLGKDRVIAHTRCKHEFKNGDTKQVDWFIGEGIGIYKFILTSEFPQSKKLAKIYIRSEMVKIEQVVVPPLD